MRCSKCGTDNPSTNNFCAKCGKALAKQCAKCKTENPPTSDFCGKCGAPLTNGAGAAAATSSTPGLASGVRVAPESGSPEALEGERKTVTALFADIKGSTELEQDLDPEEARAIVDPALKLMIDAVRRYDGYIVQIDRRWHLRAVRRAGGARGPSATRAVCGAPDAGGAETVLGTIARGWQSAA